MLATQYLGKRIYCIYLCKYVAYISANFSSSSKSSWAAVYEFKFSVILFYCMRPDCSVSYLVHSLPVVCLPVGWENIIALDLEPLGWESHNQSWKGPLEMLGPGALGKPRGSGWRGRWEGVSGWGIQVNPWLFHFNVWQNPPQIKK